MKRKSFFNVLIPIIFIISVVAVYYAVFVREFVSRKYIIGGDTYLHWSLKYMMLYSLKTFGELPWWDPTMYNGYPLYYHFISGWSNYLGPFYLLSLAIFKGLNSLSLLTINDGIILHEALYVIVLIVIALYLISRELVSRGSPAAFLPPFLFCFSFFPLLNFHDFYSHEAMIAPLFYIWGLVRFNNRRTPGNLLLLLFMAGCLAASLCNGIMMSAFFWTTIFTFLVLVTNPTMIRDAWRVTVAFLKRRHGRALVFLAVIFVMAGLAASFLPVYYNAGDTIVYRNGSVDYFSDSKFTNDPIKIEKSKIWTVLSNWLPFPAFQKERLNYGWDGHDHRYIGIVTIPLILFALFYAPSHYVIPLLLTYCLCNTFIIYSTDNMVYRILLDNSDFFRNVRNITSILSRGGGHLFLLLLSGVGLDGLLKRRDDEGASAGKRARNLGVMRLIISAETLLLLIALGIFLIVYQSPKTVYETAFHVGWYLIIFSGMCAGLLFLKNRFIAGGIAIGIFALAFLDLTISASAYIDTYARIPWSDKKAIPDTAKLRPKMSPNDAMFHSGYHGTYHNTRGILHWGKKAWLVLATTNAGSRILENWDAGDKGMRRYPYLHLFNRPMYTEFGNIADVNSVVKEEPVFFVHDEDLKDVSGGPETLKGAYKVQKYTFNELTLETITEKSGFLYSLDNYDRFWRAYVNGKETEVYRANFALKTIRLPEGKNIVRWVYDPAPIRNAYRVFYTLMAVFAAYFLLSSRDPRLREFYGAYGEPNNRDSGVHAE